MVPVQLCAGTQTKWHHMSKMGMVKQKEGNETKHAPSLPTVAPEITARGYSLKHLDFVAS